MSYNINDLEMIQDFIVRNEEDLKQSLKFETLDKLQKEMERDILYQRHIDSMMPRVFIASQTEERAFKGFGMETGMVAILVDKDETVEIQGIKSSKQRATAMVINGVGLDQIQAEVLGELIVYNDLIKLDSSKDLVKLSKRYNGRNASENAAVSVRPAPRPNIEKESIDSKKVEEIKNEIDASSVDNAFDEKALKDAQNLLGTPTAEDIVEAQVEENKTKSSFGDKPFVFGEKETSENSNIKPLKKASSKGIKTKFGGFTDVQYMAEDGKVNEDGVPAKFANNDVAKEALNEKKGSTDLSKLVSPETLAKFTQGTHDATEEELKAINEDVTVFGKPRVEELKEEVSIPKLENIYFVDDEGDLAGLSRDKETEDYVRANFDKLKATGNYIVIQNGSLRKLDGSADFTLEEREYLVEEFRNIITDPNVDSLGIPKDVLEVMEVEVEDWDNNMETEDID